MTDRTESSGQVDETSCVSACQRHDRRLTAKERIHDCSHHRSASGGYAGGMTAAVGTGLVLVAAVAALTALIARAHRLRQRLRWRYAINIQGQLAVTQALLPMIRKARSRIIMIGPVGDRFTTEPSGQWA